MTILSGKRKRASSLCISPKAIITASLEMQREDFFFCVMIAERKYYYRKTNTKSIEDIIDMKMFFDVFYSVLVAVAICNSCLAHNKKMDSEVTTQNSKRGLSKEVVAIDVFDAIKGALVIIEGEYSVGSGFVAEFDGKKWLYTNEHVARCGKKAKASFINGKELLLTGLLDVSINRDLARMEVQGDVPSIKVRMDAPSISEPVFVFGNSDGGGVVTKLVGNVVGVGNDMIEVDAKFVSGNSGSPILDGKGRIIGVATSAALFNDPKDWVKSDTRFKDIRRYGMRIVNSKYETVEWDRYANAAIQLRELNVFKDFFLPVCFEDKKIVTTYNAKKMQSYKSIRILSRALDELRKKDANYLKCNSDFEKICGRRKLLEPGNMLYPSDEKVNLAYNKLNRMITESLKARKSALKSASTFAANNKWPCQRMINDAKKLADGFKYWHDAFKMNNEELLEGIREDPAFKNFKWAKH